jgi:hypothetical protein
LPIIINKNIIISVQIIKWINYKDVKFVAIMDVENVLNKTVLLFIRLKPKSHVNSGHKQDIVVKVKIANFTTQQNKKKRKTRFLCKRTKMKVNKKYKEISLEKKRPLNHNNKMISKKSKKPNRTKPNNLK